MIAAARARARLGAFCAAGLLALILGLIGTACADDAEARRARTTANRIEATWPLAGSGPIATYVRKLGARLGEKAGPTPYPWRFVVVRDRAANAFAIGGGRIYVNEGVVTFCENEAEVAAILAHEMAHQRAGHFRAAPASTGRDEANPRIDLGAVTQEIDPAKELEADRLALTILANAGYDPHAALSLALRQQTRDAGAAPHLQDPSRIDSLRAALAGVPVQGQLDSETFRALRQKQLQPVS